MKKNWKDFEHEVYLKLKGYEDNKCFRLISKPILKHQSDKAKYRLPEFIISSDENKLILLLDCKNTYWKKIDLGSLNRLGWAVRGFLDNKSNFDILKRSKIYFSQNPPQMLKDNEYILRPVLLCPGVDKPIIRQIMFLPETEKEIEYSILNFKYLDNFIKLHFPVPSFSSSVHIIKKRAYKGELTKEQFDEIINILKEAGPKYYLTSLETYDDIIKGSDIECTLKLLYAYVDASPMDLPGFGSTHTLYGINVESIEDDTKIFLPIGTKKMTNIILRLLNKKLITIEYTHPIVWVMDGKLIRQPPGCKLKGTNIEDKIIAFVFRVTDKGKKLLIKIYGSEKKLYDKITEVSTIDFNRKFEKKRLSK